jgi:RHS repeat-associated protein
VNSQNPIQTTSKTTYPFGMHMPGRAFGSGSYRYGFNGMEKDDEVKGSGNSYTSYFRQFDPRLGRWKSIDPINYVYESPYSSMLNSPIYFSDPKGNKVSPDKKSDREAKKLAKRNPEFKKKYEKWDNDNDRIYRIIYTDKLEGKITLDQAEPQKEDLNGNNTFDNVYNVYWNTKKDRVFEVGEKRDYVLNFRVPFDATKTVPVNITATLNQKFDYWQFPSAMEKRSLASTLREIRLTYQEPSAEEKNRPVLRFSVTVQDLNTPNDKRWQQYLNQNPAATQTNNIIRMTVTAHSIRKVYMVPRWFLFNRWNKKIEYKLTPGETPNVRRITNLPSKWIWNGDIWLKYGK